MQGHGRGFESKCQLNIFHSKSPFALIWPCCFFWVMFCSDTSTVMCGRCTPNYIKDSEIRTLIQLIFRLLQVPSIQLHLHRTGYFCKEMHFKGKFGCSTFKHGWKINSQTSLKLSKYRKLNVGQLTTLEAELLVINPSILVSVSHKLA